MDDEQCLRLWRSSASSLAAPAIHNICNTTLLTNPPIPCCSTRWSRQRRYELTEKMCVINPAYQNYSIVCTARTRSPAPIYMYCLNFLRSFLLSLSPNSRANSIHEGIVKSRIPYGVYLLSVAVRFRSVCGSLRGGIGYWNLVV